ncbi:MULTISPECIES: glycosyltransferase 87 family protein [Micrococcaceae]|uniref:glycosyltransferase 87 family protein n=1 Tax=Micrococcaceae TaxID=1268 RepID=UPI001F5F20E9|nr:MULTISPECIES: glycosyltransferase 87 family protein [Micrococcaceae]UXN32085.1 glycosyltransferase 87 family protein [Glutamicibacter sp. M10]
MVLLLVWTLITIEPTGWDLSVYREGALTLLREPQNLYGPFVGPINAPGLPFTYPTFAAIMFLPMAVFPYWVSVAVTMVASIVLTFFVAKDLALRIARRWPQLGRWVTPLTLTSLMLISGPFRDTIWFGQINILILGACYLALVNSKSMTPFVIAVGICAGIKLTPIALLILPLAMRKWRAVITGTLVFLGTQLVGLIFQWRNTLDYWFDVVRDPSRVGDVGYIDNISLQGLLTRLGAGSLIWFVLALAVGLAFIALLYRLHDKVEPVVLLGVASTCPLLVSPVSWSHHWVWGPVMAYAWVVVAMRLKAWPRRIMLLVVVFFSVELMLSAKWAIRLFGIHPDHELASWWYIWPAVPVVGMLICLVTALVAKPQEIAETN